MKSKNPITDQMRKTDNGDTVPLLNFCEKLEQSHARLLVALKSLSNDGDGRFKDWEDGQGRSIQASLERPIKLAEKLCASAESANDPSSSVRTVPKMQHVRMEQAPPNGKLPRPENNQQPS